MPMVPMTPMPCACGPASRSLHPIFQLPLGVSGRSHRHAGTHVDPNRNPTLAEALKGYRFVEQFGQGMEIVRRTLIANGHPPAEFQFEPPNAPNWVLAIVRKRA
jgi:hypothetical protein